MSESIYNFIGAILGSLSLIYVTWMGIKSNRKEAALQRKFEAETKRIEDAKSEEALQDENIADQVKGFHRTILEMLKMKQAEAIAFQEQIVGLQREITSLRDKFTTVKNSVMTMDMMGDNSPIAFWIKDLEGNRIYHNRAYFKMTGYVFEKCFGKNDFEITKDKKLADDWKNIDQKVIETKMPVMAVELACHVDQPGKYFKVLTWKWPKIYRSRDGGEHVIGVEGAAIRINQIEEVLNFAS